MASPAGGRFGRCVSPDPKSGELPKYAGSKTGGSNEYVPLRTGVSSDGGAVGGARRAVDGGTEIDLVRSGLEDTMRNSYRVISDVWNREDAAVDLRTAAMMVAVQRIAQSYQSLGI